MSSERSAYIRIALLSWVAATGIIYVFMYQFHTAYSNPMAVMEAEPFKLQYENGIYAYRILSREAMLVLNDSLFGGNDFYLSRVLVSGLSLLGFNVAFLLLLWEFRIDSRSIFIPLLLMDLLIGFSTGVRSNPYTLPSMFLIFAGISAAERRAGAATIVWIVLASLNHECSLLIVIYALSRAFLRSAPFDGREIVISTLGLLVWGAIYVGLRVWIDADTKGGGTFQYSTLKFNLRLGPLLVLALVVASLRGLLDSCAVSRLWREGYRDLLVTTAFMIPYGIYMLFVGLLAEFRLFLPFFPLVLLMHLLTRPVAAPASTAS